MVVPPVIIHFNGIFQCKPSILRYPHFWKPPFVHCALMNKFTLRSWNTGLSSHCASHRKCSVSSDGLMTAGGKAILTFPQIDHEKIVKMSLLTTREYHAYCQSSFNHFDILFAFFQGSTPDNQERTGTGDRCSVASNTGTNNGDIQEKKSSLQTQCLQFHIQCRVPIA